MSTSTSPSAWLEIDLKGFAQVLRNKGIARIALEPISNALDTDTRHIDVAFTQSHGWAGLIVTDEDPEGFADLRDAYTMFAPSKRRDDPTKRGRFGQGEKELIAICAGGGEISIASTTGTVRFDHDGRTESSTERRDAGTELMARFRCNQSEGKDFESLVRSLLVPEGVVLTYNDEKLPSRIPVKTVVETLPTKIVDEEGNLSDTRRQTSIEFYEPLEGEKATIYELGVPVVVHDGRWHVNVMQKVPLNSARDNVTPSYLRKIREIMLNETHDLLTEVDMKKAWVTDALPNSTPEALTDVVEKIHGKDAVVYDPSNPEANKRAIDEGRTVIYSRQFTPDTWTRIKEHQIVRPAGQVIPVGIPTAEKGVPPIPFEEWTPQMIRLANYVIDLGEHLLGFQPDVEFHRMSVTTQAGHHAAWWGNGTITFNLGRLGKTWPDTVTGRSLDALVIHEFAHHLARDHFSDRYIDATCDLGAKLRSCSHTWEP